MYSAADITFDAAGHTYRRADGVEVPSVTEILRATGVSTDFTELRETIGRRRAEGVDLKRDIGKALHADAHAYDDNDLDWSTVDERVKPYLEAWAVFRSNTGAEPLTRERIVYHAGLEYVGTLDGIFRLPGVRLLGAARKVLIDIKTGDPEDSGCQFQTAGYVEAYECGAMSRIDRWGVQLVPDRRVPYLIEPYTDWRDFQKFQAFVTTYQHQAARRRGQKG